MTRTTTRFASLIVVTGALLSCFAIATTAFAAPGDNVANATSLNTYFGSELTTSTIGGGLNPSGRYYFRAELSKGNTFSATFRPSAGMSNLDALVLPFKSDGTYRIVASSLDASGVAHLNFMAPSTGGYTVYFATSSLPGTFSVTPALVPATKFSLGAMSVPSAKHGKTFTVSMTMKPAYNGPTCPVKFYVERKVSGHYKSYTTKRNASFYTRTTYSKFTRTLNLPKGTFRVRARFADAAHTTARYNSWHTFSVK